MVISIRNREQKSMEMGETGVIHNKKMEEIMQKESNPHTSAKPAEITSIDRNVRVQSSLTKTSHLLKSIQYLLQILQWVRYDLLTSLPSIM